jgi:hypothetical protein
VECKYRHDGTKWVFTPHDYEPFWGPDFEEVFVVLDQCCTDRQVNREVLGRFRDNYPLCRKGIELLPEDANPKSIEQAVRQLRHAVVAKTLDALQHQVDGLLGTPTPIFVIVPIIVTTAELWRLKNGTTLEQVRSADEIDSVADPLDIAVLLQEPDNLDKRATASAFYEGLDQAQKNKLNDIFAVTNNGNLSFFIENFSSYRPSLFVVIRYEKFQSAITNLKRFFAQEAVLKTRQSKGAS